MVAVASPSDYPRVSVLMPVFNAAAYLAEAVESVLAQSFANFELLLHDDGSRDGSWKILQDYAARDPRIRISQGPNAGIAAVLNRLTEAARGTYLARMDADDICLPTRFEKQVQALDAAPDLALVSSDCLVIDAQARPIHFVRVTPCHEEIDAQHLRGVCAVMHPTVMMRRQALRAVGGYNEAIGCAEDLELWLRLAEQSKLANLPLVLLHYRIHDQSVSSTCRDQQRRETQAICEAAGRRRGVSVPFESHDWRMQDTRASRRRFYLRYAWQAWNAGFRHTWWHYSIQSVRLCPYSVDAWKALIFGALRSPQNKVKHG